MLKRIIKTSFFSLGSRGFLTLTNLIIMFSISRELGESKLGVYSISAFVYYLFSFLTSFELTTYFGKEVAHLRDRIEELKKLVGELVTTFVLGLFASGILLLILFLFYKKLPGDILVISALSGIIFGIEKNLAGVLLGREKMHYEFISQIVAFVMVALPVLFLVNDLDITGVYWLRIVASFVTIGLRSYFTRINQLWRPKDFRLKFYNLKEIGFFSASGFSYFIQHHFDLFVLSFLIPNEVEGAYYLALRIYLSFCMLAEMTSFALTPYISRVYRNKEGEQEGQQATFQLFSKRILTAGILMGAVASVFLFFSRNLLISIFSKSNNTEMSADFLYYFSFFLFFRFVSYYTGNMLTSTRFQNIRFYILISSAVLMIGLESILGVLYSVQGIIYTRGVVELFIFIAYFVAIAKIRQK
jgi:O-antigen/teichoic acid export membrane protein